MSSPNGSLSMSYIGTNSTERTQAGSTPYTYNLLGLGTEKDSSGNVIAYTRDSSGNLIGERTKAGNYFYLFDGLGSVVSLIAAKTDAVVSNYIYDPYGVVEQQSGTQYNPWQFAGGYYDATTLYEKFGTAECQELCKLSKVLASFAGADKNTLCIFLLCSPTK